jgi:rRNA processing protein Krr1/Pno1
LDDLKVIVANSFDQMSRSIGRTVGEARKEANAVELYAEQKDPIQGGTLTRVGKHQGSRKAN